MNLELITKLERIYSYTAGILNSLNIPYFIMGGFCLYKNDIYKHFITSYPILKTGDIDIKVILNDNTIETKKEFLQKL